MPETIRLRSRRAGLVCVTAFALTLTAFYLWGTARRIKPLSVDEEKLLGLWHNPYPDGVDTFEFLPDRTIRNAGGTADEQSHWHLEGARIVVSVPTTVVHPCHDLTDFVDAARRFVQWPPRNPFRETVPFSYDYEVESLDTQPSALRYGFDGFMTPAYVDAMVFCRTIEDARVYDQELMDALDELRLRWDRENPERLDEKQ